MKRTTWLAVALVFVVGCSKGSDPSPSGDPAPKSAAAASGTSTAGGATAAPAQGSNLASTAQPAAGGATPAPGTATTPATTSTPTTPAVELKPDASGKYTFKYAPQIGVATYKVTVGMDMGQGKPMEQAQTMTVKTSKGAGDTYNVETTTSGGAGMGGAPATPQTITSVYDSHGKVIKSGVDGKLPGGDPFSSIMSPTQGFPNHPVKVGESWSNSTVSGKSSFGATYKLIKVSNEGGVQIATVQMSAIKIPAIMGMKIGLSKPALMTLEMSTGTLHSMAMDMAMSMKMPAQAQGGPAGGKPTSMNMKMHMTMQKQ